MKKTYRRIHKNKFLPGKQLFIALSFIFGIALIIGILKYAPIVILSATDITGWSSNLDLGKSQKIKTPEDILEVTISFNASVNPKITIPSAKIKRGRLGKSVNDAGPYTLEMMDAKNTRISSIPFSIPTDIYPPPPLKNQKPENPPLKRSKLSFTKTVPYSPKIKSIRIVDPRGVILARNSNFTSGHVIADPQFRSITGDEALKTNSQSWLRSLFSTEKTYAQSVTTGFVEIVLIGDGYTTASLMNVFHTDVIRVVNTFLSYEPFRSRANVLRFTMIDNTSPLGCAYSGRVIVCNDAKVIEQVNRNEAPNGFIIVLVNNQTYGGAFDGVIATAYNGYWSGHVAVHEFAHEFSRLSDEYILNHPGESLNKNCYPNTPPNPAWSDIVDAASYFPGCNYNSFFRTSANSIMRSIDAPYFNTISQKFLNDDINYYSGTFNGQIPTPTTIVSPTMTPYVTRTPTQTPIPTPIPTVPKSPTPTSNNTTSGCTSYVLTAIWGKRTPEKLSDGNYYYLSGSADGELSWPYGVVSDADGNIYVSDTGNKRIQKFDSSGKFLLKWGSDGSGNGQFKQPTGIALDSKGNVYVADSDMYGLNRIQKFTATGTFITAWGSRGSGNGQFNRPFHIDIDSQDNVYVADLLNYRIQKFDSTGKFLTVWGNRGSGSGQFINPWGVGIQSDSTIMIADGGNQRIQVFSSNGDYLYQWGSKADLKALPTGLYPGQFFWPSDIEFDSAGNIYILDVENDRVQKFDSQRNFITMWGSEGVGDGQFRSPSDMTIDPFGNVYVASHNDQRIQKFSCR